jgi:hypothetical protein
MRLRIMEKSWMSVSRRLTPKLIDKFRWNLVFGDFTLWVIWRIWFWFVLLLCNFLYRAQSFLRSWQPLS